jgi:anti-sigma28 factor (negative regulator of flagellin synthesis)
VAAVQAALAAGTYSVPASAVASRVIDSMLTADQGPGQS